MKRNALAVTMIFLLLFLGDVFAEDAKTADPEVRYVVTKLNPPHHSSSYIGSDGRHGASNDGVVLLNNRGQVVWLWSVSGSRTESYGPLDWRLSLWEKGRTTILYKMEAENSFNYDFVLKDFNDLGQIIGRVGRRSMAFTEEALIKEEDGWPKPLRWSQTAIWDTKGNVHYIGEQYKSVVWGAKSEHSMFYPGRHAFINNQGTVACSGFVPQDISDHRCLSGEVGVFLFSWDSRETKNIDLASLDHRPKRKIRRPQPTAINDLGNVVGITSGAGGPFIWWKEEDRVERINPLEKSHSSSIRDSGWLCSPSDINDRNQVVGNDNLELYKIGGVKREGRPFNVERAWIWQEGHISQLPVLAPSAFSKKSYWPYLAEKYKRFKEIGPEIVFTFVYAINDSGQAVGEAGLYYSDRSKKVAGTAVIWENGEVIDLNSLVPPDTPSICRATDINDYGQIVVEARRSSPGRGSTDVYLLTPISLLDGKSVAELDLPGKPEIETEEESESVALKDD